MAFRLAYDLDGTLADMEGALQREAEQLFGERVDVCTTRQFAPNSRADVLVSRMGAPPRDPGRPRALDRGEQSRLWHHVRKIDNFWATLQEIESGAVAALAATAKARGWEILFLTQRPDTAGDTVQMQSQRWLRTHGFELPSVSVVSGSRGRVAESLGLHAVVDDQPENCLDVATDSNARPLLVWRGPRGRVPPGISRFPITIVSSMGEGIECLTELQASQTTTRGILSRLRQAVHSQA